MITNYLGRQGFLPWGSVEVMLICIFHTFKGSEEGDIYIYFFYNDLNIFFSNIKSNSFQNIKFYIFIQ